MNKYELTEETIVFLGRTLYRIRALKSFSNVKEGDLGGYIEKEINLSQEGNAWVSGDAEVSGNAWVSGDAEVSGNARVSGNAEVSGNARVSGNAEVSGNAWVYGNAEVSGDAEVSGNAEVSGDAEVSQTPDVVSISPIGSEDGIFTAYKSQQGVSCSRGCFSGTLQEFEDAVQKNHGDSKTGREYQLVIELVKLRLGEEG